MKLAVSTGNLNLTWIRMKIRKLKTLNDGIINHRNILDEETKTESVSFFCRKTAVIIGYCLYHNTLVIMFNITQLEIHC